jgi:hypothetical protein
VKAFAPLCHFTNSIEKKEGQYNVDDDGQASRSYKKIYPELHILIPHNRFSLDLNIWLIYILTRI